MIINKGNWFAMYHKWIYGYFPEDICSFFWATLTAVILSPFIIPGKNIAKINRDRELQTNVVFHIMIGVCIYLLSLIIVGVGNIVLEIFGYIFIYTWSVIIGGVALGALFLIVVFTIVWLLLKLFRRAGDMTETHIIDNATDFIAAVRGKYCTRITWTDETSTITNKK